MHGMKWIAIAALVWPAIGAAQMNLPQMADPAACKRTDLARMSCSQLAGEIKKAALARGVDKTSAKASGSACTLVGDMAQHSREMAPIAAEAKVLAAKRLALSAAPVVNLPAMAALEAQERLLIARGEAINKRYQPKIESGGNAVLRDAMPLIESLNDPCLLRMGELMEQKNCQDNEPEPPSAAPPATLTDATAIWESQAKACKKP